VLTGDHAVRRAFEQTHPLAVDLFGIDGASHTATSDGEETRVTYPGDTRGGDLATLLDGASDRRLTLVTLAAVLAAYEAALDRHSWRHDNGCPEQHYLRYLDTLGYTLCDVEGSAAGLEPIGLPEHGEPDGQGVAVGEDRAVEVLVLQGAEDSFDHAVGLRAPHPRPHVPQQRVVAGEGLGECRAANARRAARRAAPWPGDG